MNRKTIIKVLAAFLAFTLSFANVALLGTYAVSDLEEQEKTVDKAKIQFDAYFQEEKEVHSKTIDIEKERETLYLNLKIDEGYLTNGSIKIENSNFTIQKTDEEFEMVQNILPEENRINLNQIKKGESLVLEVPVKINSGSSFDVKDISKTASIILEGTYVNNKGKEISVSKEIKVETILDGEAKSSLSGDITKYVSFDVNGNKGVILQETIKSKLANNKLPIKTTKLEIEIPIINNVIPKEVTLSAKTLASSNGTKRKSI